MTYQQFVRYAAFVLGAAAIVAAVVPGGQAVAVGLGAAAAMAAAESQGRRPKAAAE